MRRHGAYFIVAFDIDNDGCLDLLMCACEGYKVFRNSACDSPPPADLNGDGVVNGADLAILLSQWNARGSADLNGDDIVDGADLASLLISWTM